MKLSEIRAACEAATPGPWEWFSTGEWDGDRVRAYIMELYDFREATECHGCQVPDPERPGKTLCTSITGNGPTSEANARFLVIARTALPLLLKALDGIDEDVMDSGEVAELLEWAGIEVEE